jgi:hypothetical protein
VRAEGNFNVGKITGWEGAEVTSRLVKLQVGKGAVGSFKVRLVQVAPAQVQANSPTQTQGLSMLGKLKRVGT